MSSLASLLECLAGGACLDDEVYYLISILIM
jgi:hypothetical protein